MQIGARTTNAVVSVSVVTGGASYTSAPSVAFSGGGGTGAAGVAQMSGTAVESILLTSGGTGYTSKPTVSLSGGGGTSASAQAHVHTTSLRPMSFFRGRNGDVYGVDGMGRGIRWNGVDASVESIGLAKPGIAPAVTASTTNIPKFIANIQIVNAGGGYHGVPTVSISGGSPTVPATAEAYLLNGRVAQIRVTEPGKGYQSPPTVSISGGIASGATFSVGVLGSVRALTLTADGEGYTTNAAISGASDTIYCPQHGLTAGQAITFTSLTGTSALTINTQYYVWGTAGTTITVGTTNVTQFGGTTIPPVSFGALTAGRMIIPQPQVVFHSTNGLTGAFARGMLEQDGRISYLQLHAAGTGATATGITASIVGGAGTNAAIAVGMQWSVNSVTIPSGGSGSGYYAAPVVTIRAAATDPIGFGAAVTSYVNSSGNVTGASVVAGGAYLEPPTAIVLDTSAKATATLAAPQGGTYLCAIRYLDDTPDDANGPIPSSISDLKEIDAGPECGSLTWSFTHSGLDARVAAMELWRTSSNQGVLLYRVATIPRANFSSTYSDTLSEAELTDTERDGYGLMPVTLPSGQVNARRFEIPPGEFAVGCMFQDRAWYAVDTTGSRPNALLYSEIDEPESVPPENELILQENSGDTDRVVALIPLASALMVAQETHLYRLTYVAQPVLDAAVVLAANRGVLNSRCWDTMGGVAFIADSNGLYAFDGQQEEPLSVPVDNYWRDRVIDFSKSRQFHVRCDVATKVVRFHYCQQADSAPSRALCYCVATKTWWEETYPSAITAGGTIRLANANVRVSGTAGGEFLKDSGAEDSGATVPYAIRTGAFAVTPEPSRSASFVYKPTDGDSTLHLGMHYNNSPTPRQNSIVSDRGSGFVAGNTSSTLNMAKSRSSLADSNGFARAYFSGRLDDRSAGGDRHVAVAVTGAQSGSQVVLYSITMEGVTT
jgi:hypothetical protein